jgi:hypothetical protein
MYRKIQEKKIQMPTLRYNKKHGCNINYTFKMRTSYQKRDPKVYHYYAISNFIGCRDLQK